MDFSFTEDQEAIRDLAAQIFEGQATVERVKETEAGGDRIDRRLWAELAKANLLGLAVPEAHGGSGLGLTEVCLVLEQQGRRVAPVPLLPTVVLGALPLAAFGSPEQQAAWLPGVVSGDVVLSAALSEPGAGEPASPRTTATPDGDGWRLTGTKLSIPAGHRADRILVPASTPDGGVTVFLLDPTAPGVDRQPVVTTNRERQAHLVLDGARVTPADVVGVPGDGDRVVTWLTERAMVGICALQVGVAQEALRLAAEYTSGRQQFGKPLSTFQGVALKAADAFIDASAMTVTLWQAAWRLDHGLDATSQVLVAKWWASEAGQRVVHVTQHLHGGMGADVDYPVHRYFLWGKQLEDTLGGSSMQLARLGRVLAGAAS